MVAKRMEWMRTKARRGTTKGARRVGGESDRGGAGTRGADKRGLMGVKAEGT